MIVIAWVTVRLGTIPLPRGTQKSSFDVTFFSFDKVFRLSYWRMQAHSESRSKIDWNRLEGNRFIEVKPDQDGIIKSTSLPGLWMPIDVLRKRDNWKVMACIEHGLTRREHHELMDTIWKKCQ